MTLKVDPFLNNVYTFARIQIGILIVNEQNFSFLIERTFFFRANFLKGGFLMIQRFFEHIFFTKLDCLVKNEQNEWKVHDNLENQLSQLND